MNKKKENDNLTSNEEIIINNNEVVVKESKLEKGKKKSKKDYSKFGSKIALFVFGVIFLALLALVSLLYCYMLNQTFGTQPDATNFGSALAIVFSTPIIFILWVPILILFIISLLFFIISHRSKHKTMRILSPIFTLLTLFDLGFVMFYTYYIFQVVVKQ